MTVISSILVSFVSGLIAGVIAFLVQERKLRTEMRTEFMAERAVNLLLNHPNWKMRSYDVIKSKIAGFEENELRKILVRAGAVQFCRKRDGKELWGLIERNEDKLSANRDSVEVSEHVEVD